MTSLIPEFNRVHAQPRGVLCEVSVGDVFKGMYNLAASVIKAVVNFFAGSPKTNLPENDSPQTRLYYYDAYDGVVSNKMDGCDLETYHNLLGNSQEKVKEDILRLCQNLNNQNLNEDKPFTDEERLYFHRLVINVLNNNGLDQ